MESQISMFNVQSGPIRRSLVALSTPTAADADDSDKDNDISSPPPQLPHAPARSRIRTATNPNRKRKKEEKFPVDPQFVAKLYIVFLTKHGYI